MKVTIMSYVTIWICLYMVKHYIVLMGAHSYPNSDSVINSNHEMLSSFVGRKSLI